MILGLMIKREQPHSRNPDIPKEFTDPIYWPLGHYDYYR